MYKEFEPGRNAPCLCCSGMKFKNCCARRYQEKRAVNASHIALRDGDAEKALILARLDLTRYVIWHRAHTLTVMETKPEAVAEIFRVDQEALGDIVQHLQICYNAAGLDAKFSGVLTCLQGHFDYPHWQQRLLAIRAIAAMGDTWDEDVARSIIVRPAPVPELADFEFASLVLDIYSEQLGVGEQLNFIERLITLARNRAEEFQYRMLKGLLIRFIGDDKEGVKVELEALAMYDNVAIEAHKLPELRLRAEALIQLPEDQQPADALSLAKKLLYRGLESGELTIQGEAEFRSLLGKAYLEEGEYSSAFSHLKKSIELADHFQARLDYARALSRGGTAEDARTVLLDAKFERLSKGEQFDHSVTLMELAETLGDQDLLKLASQRLAEASPQYPVHRELRTLLLARAACVTSSSPQEKRSFWKKVFGKYLLLEPNFFGLGININAIVEDRTAEK